MLALNGFPVATFWRLLRIAALYLSCKDPTAPPASVHADLQGLRSLLLQLGNVKTLLDDTKVFAERAKEVGVGVAVVF